MVPVLRNVERMNYADIEKVNGCEIVSLLSAFLSWGNNCFK